MSAELETRLELARRHEFCSTFTFYNRSPDSVHFLKNSFDVLFLKDCMMRGGSVKNLNQGVTPDRESVHPSESSISKLFVVVKETFYNPSRKSSSDLIEKLWSVECSTPVCLNRS